MIVIGLYLVCLPFAVMLMKAVWESVPEVREIPYIMLFFSIWILMPMFIIYMIGKFINRLIIRKL